MRPTRPKVNESIDESAESEITILPDGRVFAFGITGPIAAVLATIPTADARTRSLLERIGRLGTGHERAHVRQVLDSDGPGPSTRGSEAVRVECTTDFAERE